MKEKRRDRMKKKREDEKEEKKRGEQKQKNVSRPSNPPDELAQNVSKKNHRRTNYSSIFLQKFRIWPFFNYLHDSNSIFRARGIKSEWVSGGTVSRSNRTGASVRLAMVSPSCSHA